MSLSMLRFFEGSIAVMTLTGVALLLGGTYLYGGCFFCLALIADLLLFNHLWKTRKKDENKGDEET